MVGPKWNDDYFKEIKQMVMEINKTGIHNVKLLGPLEHSKLVYWYQKASILVTPYLYETYSYVTLEALACETPVVSTGTHIFKGYPDGIVTVPKDPIRVAQAIEELLENDHLRKKYGRDGRKLVEKYFSWESVIKRLKKIYSDLLTDKL
jgi:glycosyltransferase involved in cell wall biosynthesis